jgi:ABC-type multidrug transport system, ATPase component
MRHDDVILEASGLRMTYGETEVLRGVDLRAGRGEVVALLGPNGAGKTTTVEILEGFRAPSAGTVRVLGEDPLTAGEGWRAQVGVVLQSWRDHGGWRVRDLLDLVRRSYLPYGRDLYDVDALLDEVGLSTHAAARIRTLSGGQRRRLDVAIGIVGRPAVLFLDEPTAGFDPVARRDFHELVHRLADLADTTILLTTHDLGEAERLADRILILDGGVIVADGSPEALAREVAGSTEVRWVHDGERHVHATADATGFVRDLLARHPDGVEGLEIVRATLEDAYLAMVRRHENTELEGADR